MMPTFSSVQLSPEVYSSAPGSPVVVYSSYSYHQIFLGCLDCGLPGNLVGIHCTYIVLCLTILASTSTVVQLTVIF